MSSRLETSGRLQELVTGISEDDTRLEHSGAYFVLHSNLRIFCRAIQSLAKLSADLYLEASDFGLSIKAYNKNKSAYAVFLFTNDFFTETDFSPLREQGPNRVVRISMKCAQAIFKGVQFMDRNYAKYEMWVDPSSDILVTQLTHAYDFTRKMEINVLESRTPFKSRVDKEKLGNVTIAPSDALMSLLSMLRSEDELAISATEDTFIFKNYGTLENSDRRVKTSADVPMNTLSQHRVNRPCDIAFNFKDFMAALSFASQHQCRISMYYDKAGQALVLALEDDINYTADFVIATWDNQDECDEERHLDSARVIRESQASQQVTQRIQSQNAPQQRVKASQNGLPATQPAVPIAEAPVAEEAPAQQPYDPYQDEDFSPYEQPPPVGMSGNLEEAREGVSEAQVSDRVVSPAELREKDREEMAPEDVEMLDLPPTPEPSRREEDFDAVDAGRVEEEPAPKRHRNNEFRRFFLSANTATQRQSQRANETVLAYDSDHEE